MHLPLAFSIHHFISSVGADAGFAAIIGLAILVLLYFAQARETTTLRDEAISASQRVEQLERRVAQLGRPPVAPAPESAAVNTQAGTSAPAAPGAPPSGVSVAPARAAANPVAAAAPAAASAASSAGASPAPPAGDRAPIPQPSPAPTLIPAAPAGVGAPALTDATRLMPATEVAREAAPARESESTQRTPSPAGEDAAREPQGPPEETVRRPVTPTALATPPPATAAAGAGQAQSAGESRSAPVAANGGGQPPRARPLAASSSRQVPPRVQTRDGSRAPGPLSVGTGSPRPRWLPALLGVLLLGAVVAVLVVATSGGGSPGHAAATRSTNAPAAKSAFNPASVTVAVLNGTDVSQLAHRVEQKLSRSGYKGGTIATAADQTHTTTVVAYLPGYQGNAMHVASSLGLSGSAVQPVDQSARAIACPPPSACGASVIVTVGSDLASTP